MSKAKTIDPEDVKDEILLATSEHAAEIADKIDASDNHAALYFGVKYIEGDDKVKEAVETYIMAVGYFGILGEGLYSELRDQLENGQPNLFAILRDVIHDLEEDMNIDPDEDFGLDDDESNRTIH
jgi:hypothetical protein